MKKFILFITCIPAFGTVSCEHELSEILAV